MNLTLEKKAFEEVKEITGELIPVTSDNVYPLGERQKELMTDPQVINLTKQIDIKDPVSIMTLGEEPSEEVTKLSSKILDRMSVADTMKSTKLMDQLSKIMDQFDMNEVLDVEEKKGFIGFLKNKKRDLQHLLAKYQSLGGEIDKVYQELRKYETTTQKSILEMKALSEKNIEYSENLDGYIATGYVLQNKLTNEVIPQLQEKVSNGDQLASIQLGQAQTALDAVDRRTADLEMAKTTAVLTSPQIDMIQKNNVLLLAQLHSAFITTIPQFKIAMIQAVELQKQRNTQEGLDALAERNNELIRRNAQNVAANSVMIARSSNKTSVSIETLQEAYNSIKQAIVDTNEINKQAKIDRDNVRVELEKIQSNVLKGE